MGNVPSGCCFKVVSDDVNEQLKAVLDYYKVVVNKEDVFSRCQVLFVASPSFLSV